jgi:hypothetical protein
MNRINNIVLVHGFWADGSRISHKLRKEPNLEVKS